MKRQGFSLLELIAALTVLVIVIGILSRIITDTQRTWRMGSDRAMMATSVRAALDILGQDLRAALSDSNLVFEVEPPDHTLNLHGTNIAHSIMLYKLDSADSDNDLRALRQIHIFSTRKNDEKNKIFRLYREVRPVLFSETPFPGDWERWAETNRASNILLENISELEIRAYPAASDTTESGDGSSDDNTGKHHSYNSTDHERPLPAVIDIHIKLLPERMARRIPPLSAKEITAHSVSFEQRLYLDNRPGGHLP